MIRYVVSAAVVSAAIGACQLPAAAFGRSCSTDDDCGDLGGERLRCAALQCVTDEYLAAIAPDAPDDPDDPDDPLTPAPAGETCGDAIVVKLGIAVEGTTGDALNDHGGVCGGSTGADRAYVVVLDKVKNLRVTLTGSFDAVLYASTDRSCSAATAVVGACVDDEPNVSEPEVLELFGVGPGEVFIIVDGARQSILPTSGNFSLRVSDDLGCDPGFNAIAGQCVGIQREITQVVARTNATATLLDDGRVLVVGGRTGSTLETTATAEIFDPIDNTFSATGSMATSRARHAAERLQNGRVVVIGGVTIVGDDATTLASVEVWDPQTDTFSAAPALPRRRDLLTATQLGNGRGILVAGGRDGASTLSDLLVLDDNLVGWSARGTLAIARFGHLATIFDNGDEVLIVGGRVGSTARALDSVESFDPRTSTLSSSSSSTLPSPRAAAAGALVSPQRFAVFGGYEGDTDTGFLAHASAATRDVSRPWSEPLGDMVEPRLFATATAVPRLGIVVAGGSLEDPTASMELYIDATESFVSLPPLHQARLAHAAVALNDGRVLFVGGDGGSGGDIVPLAQAELLGPPL